ncbi:MAG: glycerophosphodiester phosphodiesterase family protein [Alphaproteobacteria bacterium]|nr:glycerophosphodiester phosphodiesterase family protein [Alphaproteobacteria bacterium]
MNDIRSEPAALRYPRLIGHRGAAAHAPENTLAGLRAAAELGVDWVEFDVRLTADDALVLVHDDKLDRTTNGSGRVRAAMLAEIRSLDAGAWFGADFAGEAVPTLDEALAVLRELKLHPNIEIKAEAGDEAAVGRAVARAVRALWPADRPPPLISSFRFACVAAVADEAPELPLACLMNWGHKEWPDRRADLPWRAIHCAERSLTKRRVAAFKSFGLPLAAFTVNSANRARRLFEFGVDAVFTDCPDKLAAAV